MITEKISKGISDDYATIDAGDWNFYYGYEVEVDGDWAYQVKHKGHVILTFSQHYLRSLLDDPEGTRLEDPSEYLAVGMAATMLRLGLEP